MFLAMTPAELKVALRAEILRLGFNDMGVTPAGLSDPGGHLQRWLDAGMHGNMSYLARNVGERLDTRQLCRGRAKTVVMLTTPYRHATPDDAPASRDRHDARPALQGRVSRYASGRDYHRVIQKRLRKLRRWFDAAAPGAWLYSSVDTGPVMEKTWAARAGLGWIGKHGNLLNRERSSWFFLSTLATNLELPPDEPAVDHCGTCDLCIRACPTAAIVAPRVVDARACISYHTIEHDGPIPEPLRAGHHDWVFGCDDCQDVCPWNRFAKDDGDPAFAPRAEQAHIDLLELLAMPRADVAARFMGTPLSRAGRDGLARSSAVALGNARDERAVPALAHALANDESTVVRGHAAWALGRIGGAEARAALAAEIDTPALDASVREEIARALEALSGAADTV